MSRIHAFEILDQPWTPQWLRDAGTDYLEFMARATDGYAPIVERLARAIERSGTRRIVDLCAGGGGPWVRLLPALEAKIGEPLEVELTDARPNLDAFARTRERVRGGLRFRRDRIDAMRVPDELRGFRTIFAAFHHFRPAEARAILGDAVAREAGIGIFEGTGRHVLFLVPMLLAPLICWVVTPFLRPLRWWRLVFTYLIPVIPIVIAFDGIVSCLRTYSPEELRALVGEIEAPQYEWEIGIERMGVLPIGVTYLIGYPAHRTA